MVNPDKVKRLLSVLLDALADLRRYREALTREALNSSRDSQHMVLHALYVAIQACVDIALHVAADSQLGQPPSYQGAFHRLGEAGVLPADLARRLAAWAGFRNIIAHSYAVIDFERVFDALGEISDLEELAVLVEKLANPTDG